MTPEKVNQVVHMTLHEKPPNATHWSMRSMAKAAGNLLQQRPADFGMRMG